MDQLTIFVKVSIYSKKAKYYAYEKINLKKFYYN